MPPFRRVYFINSDLGILHFATLRHAVSVYVECHCAYLIFHEWHTLTTCTFQLETLYLLRIVLRFTFFGLTSHPPPLCFVYTLNRYTITPYPILVIWWVIIQWNSEWKCTEKPWCGPAHLCIDNGIIELCHFVFEIVSVSMLHFSDNRILH